jgi:hypothetical protein
MKRRFSGERFGGNNSEQAYANPLEGVANLVDVMLVIAVGLMLALVVNWNVDIASKQDAASLRGEEIAEASGLSGEGVPLDNETQYEALDVVVYRDPATGKLYMVEKSE